MCNVKYELKYNLLPHIALACALMLLTPVLFGIAAQDATGAAVPLELCLPFAGVILLTPVYAPERDPGILETVRARKTPQMLTHFTRVILAAALTFTFICGFSLVMAAMETDVTAAHVFAACANAVFLGGLGAFASALLGNPVTGYMVPVLYFIIDMMGGISGFTIFSLTRYGTTEGKGIIFLAGTFLALASVLVREMRLRR